MRVTIYQPRYFPQLHYFNRIFHSDIFVILESAQYTKGLIHIVGEERVRHKSYQSDTPIKIPNQVTLLTVPIKSKQGLLPISETHISYDQDWAKKHLSAIRLGYMKAINYSDLFPEITKLLAKQYTSLAELNNTTIFWSIAKLFNFPLSIDELTEDNINYHLQNAPVRLKKIVTDTTLGIPRPPGNQKGTEWTTAICDKLGATEYFHGGTAKDAYMDDTYYKKNNIKLINQDWQCAEYPQRFSQGTDFLPNLSIIDLLCNVTETEARKILNVT